MSNTVPLSGQGAPATVGASGNPRSMIFPSLVAAFALVLVVSNINATKGVTIGPLVTDAAFFLFPLSYVIGDVITECYGLKTARRVVALGFAAIVFAVACFAVAIWLPAAEFYPNQEAFATVLGAVPQIVLAGLAGYTVGQLLNAWSLHAIKARTGEKSLWLRLVGSTVLGEFFDTLIFCSIAATAIGIDSIGAFINFVVVGFLWKCAVEVAVLPVTYRVINWVKSHDLL